MDFKVIFVLFLSTNSHQVLSFRKVDMRNKKSLILKITENMVTPSAILFLPFSLTLGWNVKEHSRRETNWPVNQYAENKFLNFFCCSLNLKQNIKNKYRNKAMSPWHSRASLLCILSMRQRWINKTAQQKDVDWMNNRSALISVTEAFDITLHHHWIPYTQCRNSEQNKSWTL